MGRDKSLQITVKDFSKICRFCMQQSEILKAIFKNEVSDTEENITNMFMECLNLDIDANSQLPLFICSECIGKLFNSYNFRKQCIESFNRLNEIYRKEQEEVETCDGDDDEHKKIEKAFCFETEIKKEDSNSDDEHSQRLLNINVCSKIIEPMSGDSNESRIISYASSNISKNNEILRKNLKVKEKVCRNNSTKMKKRVGRPKKPIEEKVVKAPGMCQICGGLYVGLKYHMFVHDETPKFECDYCGRKFKHKSNLFAHVRIHANDRKHQCPHCPYKFQDRAKFLRHLKIHTGERNVNCDLCGKAFCRKTDMLKHRLIHDVPRVPCPHCDKMFTTKTNMLSHVGIHTGERNFKCETCGAAFVASSSLSNHRKIHKKENPVIQCKECGITVADTAMLKNHMRDHQNIVMLE